MSDSSQDTLYHPLAVYGAHAECPETHVIYPPRDRVRKSVPRPSLCRQVSGRIQCTRPFSVPILIHQLPAAGAKCRVDTSLNVTLDLVMVDSDRGGASYGRVGSWRWLRLPEGTYTKGQERKTTTSKGART